MAADEYKIQHSFQFHHWNTYWSEILHPLAARIPGLPPGIGQQKTISSHLVLAPRPWDSKFRKPLGFWFHSQNCLWVGAQLTEITRENHAVLADHRQIINHMCKIYASTVSLPGIFRFVCLIHPYRPCTQLPWIYRVDSFVHFVTVNSTVYSNVKICSPVL